jgi:hypothetical protein
MKSMLVTANHRISQDGIELIAAGPAFVQNVFSACWGEVKSAGSSLTEKYQGIIELIKTGTIIRGKNKTALEQFYLGYFHEQAAFNTTDKKEKRMLLETALSHYHEYMKIGKGKGEENYYSRLHAGYIMHAFGYSWPKTEEVLLNAYETDPARGESMELIIHYYMSVGEYAIAYIFSLFSKDMFYGRMPFPERKWGLDPDFYNWRVLDIHVAICCQLGQFDEAADVFSVLKRQTRIHPELLSQEEITKIGEKSKLFQTCNYSYQN